MHTHTVELVLTEFYCMHIYIHTKRTKVFVHVSTVSHGRNIRTH